MKDDCESTLRESVDALPKEPPVDCKPRTDRMVFFISMTWVVVDAVAALEPARRPGMYEQMGYDQREHANEPG